MQTQPQLVALLQKKAPAEQVSADRFLLKLSPACANASSECTKTQKVSCQISERPTREDLQQPGEHLHGAPSAVCNASTLEIHQCTSLGVLPCSCSCRGCYDLKVLIPQTELINVRYNIFFERYNFNHLRLRPYAKCGSACFYVT